jgi:hypothetical protein
VLILVPCPDCDVPAEVTERFSLGSTDGPVSHIALSCAAGHHFRMPADWLPGCAQALLAEPEAQPASAPAIAQPRAGFPDQRRAGCNFGA